MANSTDAATSAIDDRMSHQLVAAPHTGDSSMNTKNQATTNTKQPDCYQIVGQRPNLLYTEDLGYIPMQKDPQYVFYRHGKSQKFDIQNEDVLHAIEEHGLLQNLELLHVSRSNKSIEIRFDSEQTAQHFVECDVKISGSSFPFRGNAQRRLRVSIHGVDPNVPAALEYELLQYFGGVLEIKRDTKQYKTKVYQTGTRTFLISELYEHIPRSCCIMNRWCLVYYTGQPYTARKNQTQMESRQNEPSNSDKEESMSTSDTDSNLQKDLSDERSDATFDTVEKKDIGFTLKRNMETECEPPTSKKNKSDKGNCFDMELMIQQLTTIVRELEEHDFRMLLMSSGRIKVTR